MTTQAVMANGGPVNWNKATFKGNLHVKQEDQLSLLSENLRIKIIDQKNYSVNARYMLSNPGTSKTVQFGVPVTWQNEMEAEEESGLHNLSLKLENKIYRCNKLINSKKASQYSKNKELQWCVFSLRMPGKKKFPLTLKYTGALEFADWATNKSSEVLYDPRVLRYSLWPAGYWAGNAKKIEIQVDLGKFSNFAAIKGPKGFKKKKNIVTWTMKNVNLKKAKDLAIELQLDDILPSVSTVKALSKNRSNRLSINATSTLKSQGKSSYLPQNALDGNLNTAWCEGVNGYGKGQIIKLQTKAQKVNQQGPFHCLKIIPGYAKSSSTWYGNGQVVELKLQSCNKNRTWDSLSYTPSSLKGKPIGPCSIEPDSGEQACLISSWKPLDFEYKGKIIHLTEGGGYTHMLDVKNDLVNGKPTCMEVEIISIKAGSSKRDKDTCIAEIDLTTDCE
jgi:hypothetical protein